MFIQDRSWFMICNIIHKLRYTAQNITSYEDIYFFLLIFILPFYSFQYVCLILVCPQTMSILYHSYHMFLISLCDFYLETKISHHFCNLYIHAHVLNTTLGIQFANLSPTFYFIAKTTHCTNIMGNILCLTWYICGAIASCHHPDGLLPQCHLSFSDAWWDTRFYQGEHHSLIKWRSCHNLLSTVIAIFTWKHLGTILTSSIPNSHSIWNTWDISTLPWIVTWFHWSMILRVSVPALVVHRHFCWYLEWNSSHF